MNSKSNAEQEYLKNYDITKFERPSVATDILVFALDKKSVDNYRKNSELSLKLLLIKRGEYPFKNKWALPGGFLRSTETVEECAIREIKEETGLTVKNLKYIGVFSDIDRDPRGRIVSNSYLSIVNEIADVKGDTDAKEAKWFEVEYSIENNNIDVNLSGESESLSIKIKKNYNSLIGTDYQVVDMEGLAFDHGKIIATAIVQMIKSVEKFDLIFDFLPEKFTLSEVQKLYELLTKTTVTAANFRRKISDYVSETEEITTGNGHRPAKMFIRKTV